MARQFSSVMVYKNAVKIIRRFYKCGELEL